MATATIMAVTLYGSVNAQLLNGGFENWSGDDPVDWSTSNLSSVTPNVTQTTDAFSGTFAARGECVLDPTGATTDPYPPFLRQFGTGAGVSVNDDYLFLNGWFQLVTTASSTYLDVTISMLDTNAQITGVGARRIFHNSPTGYAPFHVPVNYSIGGTSPAATALIQVSLMDSTGAASVGSWFVVDSLELTNDYTVNIGDGPLPRPDLRVSSPYPQPFSDHSSFSVELDRSEHLTIIVMDATGRTVATLADHNFQQGGHLFRWSPDASFMNGMYLLQVRSASVITTSRLLLQR